jgi:hypothetical protein
MKETAIASAIPEGFWCRSSHFLVISPGEARDECPRIGVTGSIHLLTSSSHPIWLHFNFQVWVCWGKMGSDWSVQTQRVKPETFV